MIEYSNTKLISADDFIELLNSSTLGSRRPIGDKVRIGNMLENATIIWTAWDKKKLVGIARGLTDFSFDCYLSDLAVSSKYQKQGIGKELIAKVKEQIGPDVQLILTAAPAAINYYPKIGFTKLDNAFSIKRLS